MRSRVSAYERSSSSMRSSSAAIAAKLAGQLGVQRDFGNAGKGFRDRTVLLRVLRRHVETRAVEPRNGCADVQRALDDPFARLEGEGRRRLETLRRMAVLGEAARERHREARRPRGGDQLL